MVTQEQANCRREEVSDVDVAHIQIMLTVFTTVAGILAGFITGQALGTSGSQRRDEGKQ
jgi:hypothetical protein